ncbi:serine protease inhibitor A6 [Bombina bombina]|uniref:serine protease inhibitor A6 n=1 Tax=Bombina bombina TaxID=8345 RepID=UPI00235AD5D9|nr:serine protease inhibitor A6 [Bombina bombina]XP_053553492.1 serine protease inhibitor A6 [Bombina bombina]
MNVLPFLCLSIALGLALDHEASHDITQEQKSEHNEEKHTKALEAIATSNAQFAIDLFKHLVSSHEDQGPENMVFSPISISTAFAMLSLGAKSVTHKQILEGLRLNETNLQAEEIHEAFEHLIEALNKPKSNLQVNIGNAAFVQEKLNLLKSFVHEVEHHYHAEVLTADFPKPKVAEQQINEYVKNKTEGKIEEAVHDLDPQAKLLLLNYILFKGEWENIFNPDFTQQRKFTVDANTTVDVQMMHRMGIYNSFHDTELPCSVLLLPYKNNASMLLIAPELGKINQIEEALSVETITRWTNSMQKRFIELGIPKFSVRSSINLNIVLNKMGMIVPFSDNSDFSGITEDAKLTVSKAQHEAILEVDEKGTEAAAVTTIEIVPISLIPSFTFNKPFILLICSEQTYSILFMGKVTDPSKK